MHFWIDVSFVDLTLIQVLCLKSIITELHVKVFDITVSAPTHLSALIFVVKFTWQIWGFFLITARGKSEKIVDKSKQFLQYEFLIFQKSIYSWNNFGREVQLWLRRTTFVKAIRRLTLSYTAWISLYTMTNVACCLKLVFGQQGCAKLCQKKSEIFMNFNC